MYIFVVSVHIVLCTMLVFVILMQPGKGADVSSAFGGGASSQLFGAAGSGNFLTRGTAAVAGLFMVTSVALTFLGESQTSGGGAAKEIVKDVQDDGAAGAGFGVAPMKSEGDDKNAPATQDEPDQGSSSGSTAPPAGAETPAPPSAPLGGAAPTDAPAGAPSAPAGSNSSTPSP